MGNLTPLFSSSTFWLHLHLFFSPCLYKSIFHPFIYPAITSFVLSSPPTVFLFFLSFWISWLSIRFTFIFCFVNNKTQVYPTFPNIAVWNKTRIWSWSVSVDNFDKQSGLKLSHLIIFSHHRWFIHSRHYFGGPRRVNFSAPFPSPFTCIKFHCYTNDTQL